MQTRFISRNIFIPLTIAVMLLWSLSLAVARTGLPDKATATLSHAGECVALVHGLGRTSRSMEDLEDALRTAGYKTVNIDYPSRQYTIQDLAAMIGKAAVTGCRQQGADTIHFITHSMGGILVRYYLAKNAVPELGRVVMLAPPNQGSQLTDQLRDEAWYRWLLGPAAQQLGTGKDGVPRTLGPVDYPTGVIAGNVHHPVDGWLAEKIPGVDDGKVAVDHAKVEGMKDFLVLPYTHISIMQEDEVIAQSLYFLQHGRFDHAASKRLHSRSRKQQRGAYLD